MSSDLRDTLLWISTVLQGIASVAAVVLAVLALKKADESDKQSKEREHKVTVASVKPFLLLEYNRFAKERSLRLMNQGLGPAIITYVKFESTGKPTTADLLALMRTFEGPAVAVYSLDELPVYIRAGEAIDMVRSSTEMITDDGRFTPAIALHILGMLDTSLRQINVTIEYEDIFGNKQPRIARMLAAGLQPPDPNLSSAQHQLGNSVD